MIADLDGGFDYVVCGAGTSGAVVAARLSEDRNVRVALLEAGPRDTMWYLKVPTAVVNAIVAKNTNWHYFSAPQTGLDGRKLYLPRGKVLGGSGAINGMAFYRGHPGDFNDWEKLGNPGWSYADVLPYFIRLEDNPEYAGSPYHGTAGPVRIKNPPAPNRLIFDFLDAAKGLNLPGNLDFNGPDPEGIGQRQANIRDGIRDSTAKAYLRAAEKRSNLTVVTGAMVDRVVFKDRRAVAVEAVIDGVRKQIAARREIVLCGGAYGSPAILLRSGVGDGGQLSTLGIPLVHHLPGVGAGLKDHPMAGVQMKTNDTTSFGVSLRSTPRNILHVLNYALRRKGPIAGNIFEATGFLKTSPGLERPDLQLVFMPAHRNKQPYSVPIGHGYGILSIAVRPKASGSVTLASKDPSVPPVIDPKFLSEESDLGTIRHGLLLARRILARAEFGRYNAHEILPGPGIESSEELDAYIRTAAITVHHPGCTARMGTDEMAVVDSELRVRGLQGLRVADASIYPTLVAGNTNASCIMIGEKAADLIANRPPPPPVHLPHAL